MSKAIDMSERESAGVPSDRSSREHAGILGIVLDEENMHGASLIRSALPMDGEHMMYCPGPSRSMLTLHRLSTLECIGDIEMWNKAIQP